MVESGSITYVHPSKCHSRESEVQNEAKHKTKSFITIEQGSLKSTCVNHMDDVDANTELRLLFAFQRRGLAFELVNFMSWSVYQTWTDKLMSSLASDAPKNFRQISLTQILRADRENFSLLAIEHKGSVRAAAGGKPPVDATLND